MLFSRIRVRVTLSVWFVSGYAHVFILLSLSHESVTHCANRLVVPSGVDSVLHIRIIVSLWGMDHIGSDCFELAGHKIA